ncbi:Lysophospholipid transporter LplT [hydrothermal vent metagenome]|uniref:Lysophospholipid transporter LplT n=1 Tax=hydrothermal vent metagenome TaxID=652676 RepID=A0A3B0Z938_9ZZZZ
MNKGVYALLVAQFLSAFADNAILFTIISMVMINNQEAGWYIPALQGSFLVAFVLLAPWVGSFADKWPKPWVLIIGNIFKALGVVLILFAVEPIVAYAIVGVGAAIYGPAKYGLLPEMVGHQSLVKANGLIEGATIFAIILGTFIGAKLADWSIQGALYCVLVFYGLSILITFLIPRLPARGTAPGAAIPKFKKTIQSFFLSDRARFAILGASLFWAASAVLRVLIVAWAPLVLLSQNASDVAELTLFVAIGIITGAALVPKLIPLEHLRRARWAAYLMGVFIVALSFVDALWPARIILFLSGLAGGLFVVPVNAALQEIGHKTIGSGGAIAIQNFFENLAMLFAVGIYSYATTIGADPTGSIFVLGVLIVLAALFVAWRLPPDEKKDPGGGQ